MPKFMDLLQGRIDDIKDQAMARHEECVRLALTPVFNDEPLVIIPDKTLLNELKAMLEDFDKGLFSNHYHMIDIDRIIPTSRAARHVPSLLDLLIEAFNKIDGISIDRMRGLVNWKRRLDGEAVPPWEGTDTLTCCICGGQIEIDKRSGWNQGHNAWPVVEEGRCCGNCNASVVIPERIERAKSP